MFSVAVLRFTASAENMSPPPKKKTCVCDVTARYLPFECNLCSHWKVTDANLVQAVRLFASQYEFKCHIHNAEVVLIQLNNNENKNKI